MLPVVLNIQPLTNGVLSGGAGVLTNRALTLIRLGHVISGMFRM